MENTMEEGRDWVEENTFYLLVFVLSYVLTGIVVVDLSLYDMNRVWVWLFPFERLTSPTDPFIIVGLFIAVSLLVVILLIKYFGGRQNE